MGYKPGSRVLDRVCVVGGMLVLAAVGAGCTEPPFAVGDCVRIEQRAIDYDLNEADCATARGTFDAAERTYKIDEVLDGTDRQCGPPQGFFPVTFSHGGHGVTYCMSQAEGF